MSNKKWPGIRDELSKELYKKCPALNALLETQVPNPEHLRSCVLELVRAFLSIISQQSEANANPVPPVEKKVQPAPSRKVLDWQEQNALIDQLRSALTRMMVGVTKVSVPSCDWYEFIEGDAVDEAKKLLPRNDGGTYGV